MSRSGYDDYCYDNSLYLWRGAVASAIRGRRGQAFLREMLVALDAMESKRLIRGDLVKDGEVCAIGVVGLRRGIDVGELDPVDRDGVASAFGIAGALAAEIFYENDELALETPEHRYERMRRWVVANIRDTGT